MVVVLVALIALRPRPDLTDRSGCTAVEGFLPSFCRYLVRLTTFASKHICSSLADKRWQSCS